jgi:deazaflavin-dependent oxidoreductase (nitroreductase family)
MARTHAVDRWMYRGRRPNRMARLVNSASARLAAAGCGPAQLFMLEVRGRRSGKPVRFPIVVADYEGERYLVSMLGEDTNWVRNVRASDGHAVLAHGRREVVRLTEVEPAGRAPVLRRYLACAPGARSHIDVRPDAPVEEFVRIAPQYPVFLVTTADQART